jgi:hypothetical protein
MQEEEGEPRPHPSGSNCDIDNFKQIRCDGQVSLMSYMLLTFRNLAISACPIRKNVLVSVLQRSLRGITDVAHA